MNKPSKNIFRVIAMSAMLWVYPALADDSNPGKEDISELTALAEKGNAIAQNSLGNMYHSGQGVPKDDAEAVKWYRKAAEQGDDYAQVGLAAAYIAGKGVLKDNVQADMWLSLAAAQNNRWTIPRNELEGSMTSEQVAEGKHLANEWTQQHSK